MAKFVPGTDDRVKSDEPLLDVLASAATPLKPGKHVFQLVVTDDSGNDSDTASVTVIVQDLDRPTADRPSHATSTPAEKLFLTRPSHGRRL